MRILLTILVTAALAHADVDNKYGTHYSQHQTSVNNARQGMQERLSKLDSQNVYQRQFGGNENYVAGCTTGCSTGSSSAYNSRLSSSLQQSSASGLENSDYVGVGVVSHGYANDENDLQQRVSARFSAGSANEADDLQQRVVPGDLSNIQSSAYRASSRSSRREEEEEEQEEDLQTNIGAGYHDLSVSNDNRYTETQRRLLQQQQLQRESESRVTGSGRTGQVYYAPGGSTSTSYRSSAQNSEAQYSESRTQKPVPVGQYVSMTVRPGTSTVLTIPVAAPDQTQQRVYASNRQGYQAVTESSRTRVQPGYQINYYPSYASDRTASSSGSRVESVTQRVVAYQPQKVTTPAYASSRYNEEEIDEDEEEDTQQRIQPANVNLRQSSASTGGSTNYQQSYTGRVVPAVPIHTVESTSSQRTNEDQRRYYQARPVYNQRVTSNRNENEQASGSNIQYTTVNRPVVTSSRIAGTQDGSQYGSSGVTYYTAPVTTQSRIQMQAQNQQGLAQSQYLAGTAAQTQYTAGSAAQNQYAAGSTLQNQYSAGSAAQNQYAAGTGSRTSGYGYQAYPQSRYSGSQRGSAGSVNQRFSTQAINANSEDLLQYMSESEKLAREQQRQIAGSQSSASQLTASEANRRTVNTASTLDSAAANFVGSTNLQSRLSDFDNVESLGGAGGTGFKRVKSWQKQSKWASGSEYDSDGKIKSHSMLSTAEAEKHNINGAETGYKAATTTLENDGKVSTYSIHTP
ncbi:serine-rich adhesin for platelets-like isoform X2 [Chironomus tepperi]|uniref:serine-rich adhesin for platelets-like isoform X2 n=1 Tax=Chironomus tepperi TaxID=113505 RepID=UPI00391F5CA6